MNVIAKFILIFIIILFLPCLSQASIWDDMDNSESENIWSGGSDIFNKPSSRNEELVYDDSSNMAAPDPDAPIPVGDGLYIMLALAGGYMLYICCFKKS